MIELRELAVGYGGQAVLSGLTLHFAPGQVTALIGPNGCGKTTLIKTALGFLPPLAGQVLYDGAPLTGLTGTQVARRATYMPQSRRVPSIEARRMVLHGRFAYLSFPRRYRRQDWQAVDKALQQAEAEALSERMVHQLSGGQRQKVYLAMALAQDTETVFMDEPTTHMDVRHQLNAMQVARRLADEGKAVVLVCHELSLALRTADRVAVLAGGALQSFASPDEVFASGALNRAFGVQVRRVQTESGWQYYCCEA